jgi:hypothetical protein
MEECGEGGEDAENMQLRHCEQLGRVSCMPVPQFVGKDSLNFTRGRCLYEGVEDDDMLRPWQTKEVLLHRELGDLHIKDMNHTALE